MDKMRFISVLKCKHTHFEADEKTVFFNYIALLTSKSKLV